ncbi:MAG: SDR family oxidoreductase [Ruminococcus sp.]|nr:SDR family oxidoreductase [Ruminococcus sp.]
MAETVVITGASRGIGKAAAELFSQKGYNVVGTFFETPQESSAIDYAKTDLSKADDIAKLAEYVKKHYGGADILINNAGIALQRLFTDCSETDYDRVMNTNTKACFLTCKAFLPYMINRKHGSIVNISSIWGITGASLEVIYSMSKAAIIGLTKALAKEVGPSGIRVNAVAPGVIDTDMNSQLSVNDLREISDNTPLCRIGTPPQIAKTIFFLCSEQADFITGQVLTVDGGFIC